MYNHEHYRDATAGLALRRIIREEQRTCRVYRLAYTAPCCVVVLSDHEGMPVHRTRKPAAWRAQAGR